MLVLWSMRALATTLIAIGVAALGGGADGSSLSMYRGKCGIQVLPRAPAGLPAPVELWNDCGVFVVGTDGVVSTRPGRGKWVVHETRSVAIDLPPPRLRPRRIGWDSGVVSNAAGDAAAFTATEGYDGHVSHGDEVVYVAEHGYATPVLRRRLLFTLCGRGVQLSWNGTWLLYGAGEGVAVAIDTETRRQIDLTRTLDRLPGAHRASDGYRLGSAFWA
jgi:hypothetical protein